MASLPKAVSPAQHWLVLTVCYAVIVVEGYDISAIGIAAPAIAHELHFSPGILSFVFSASMCGMLLGALTLGRLGDLIGRSPVLAGCLIGMGALTLAAVEARDASTLLLLRLLVGLALGGVLPTLIALTSDVSSGRTREVLVSFLFSGLSLGGVICGLAAHAVLSLGGWRAIFLIGGVLPVCLAPLALLLSKGRVVRERPDKAMAMREALFGKGRAPNTVALWAMAAATLVVFYLLLNWLPTFSVLKGFPQGAVGAAILAFNIGNLLGALVIGAAIRAVGLRVALLIVYAGLATCLVALGLARSFTVFVGVSAVAGLCVNAAQAAIYGVTPSHFPDAARATGAGSVVAAARIGSILGPLYAGFLFALHQPVSVILILSAPVTAVAAAALIGLGQSRASPPIGGSGSRSSLCWRRRAA